MNFGAEKKKWQILTKNKFNQIYDGISSSSTSKANEESESVKTGE